MKKQCFSTSYSIVLMTTILAIGLLSCEAMQKAQDRRNNRLMTDLQKSAQNRSTESSSSANSPTALVGKTAPNFTLRTVDGNTITLSEFKGKAVVLNFWATW